MRSKKEKENEKRWRDSHPEERKVYQQKYAQKHKIMLALKAKEYRENNPEKLRAQRRKSNYGIENECFLQMLEAQENKCLICEMIFNNNGTKSEVPVVDHCHISGEVRGLLCLKCNNGIGLLKDDPLIVGRAVKYLERKK